MNVSFSHVVGQFVCMYLFSAKADANSVGHDQMLHSAVLHSAVSDWGLHSLPLAKKTGH